MPKTLTRASVTEKFFSRLSLMAGACLIVLLAVCLLLPVRAGAAQTGPSVVKITVDRGREQVSGSAFYVHPNLLGTSYRLIRGAQSISMTSGEFPVPVTAVLAYNAAQDLAVVYVPVQGRPLSFGPRIREYRAKLRALGYGGGKSTTQSTILFQGWERMHGAWYLRFQGQISPGMTGGPVLDRQGAVVAIIGARPGPTESSPPLLVGAGTLHTLVDNALSSPRFLDVATFGRRTRAGPALHTDNNRILITDQ